ncbi:MAG TPA: NHL repeat-containing protein [Solirubrobacterales bacterium]|nr:NHL repeat-containing protein [Solirubrobacterales bacterium]
MDSDGRFYVADHYHDVVDVFNFTTAYITQLAEASPNTAGPCHLAVDSGGDLYVNNYHRGVLRYTPSVYPPVSVPPTDYGSGTPIGDAEHSTGVDVDTASGNVYVDNRDHIAVYDSTGAPLLDGGDPLQIGLGTLGDGYDVAVSAFGRVYVPDAADNTVKVYDPAIDADNPVDVIDGSATPAGEFVSLRDSSVAVDRGSGDVYVVDNLQPTHTEQPQGIVHVFASAGAYKGHLKYNIVHGAPTGLAVDNSATATQGRVYVTSGNTHNGGIYAYPPDAATNITPLPPTIPPTPLGGNLLFPTVSIGGPASAGSGISCEGDNCQSLPPEPIDPTLTTLLQGLGNPRIRYRVTPRNCAPLAREARKLARLSRRAKDASRRAGEGKRLQARAARLAKQSRRAARAVKRCRRANRGARSARASSSVFDFSTSVVATESPGAAGVSERSEESGAGATTAADAFGLLPGAAGFDAAVYADGGEAATVAGSHPYQLDFAVGLDQGGEEENLRDWSIDLPAGLLLNPAATPLLCSDAAFDTPRSSPFEPSESGESCDDRSQIGTVEVTTGIGGGETRRFGLFNLEPADGAALQLGASPFGVPLVFDAQLRAGGKEAFGLTLQAIDVPNALQAHDLRLSLWGIPWDATHNTERGDCLNEAEPSFPWAKCSVGEPLQNQPLAFLTLPTECGEPLSFTARVTSWQGPGEFAAQVLNRDSGGSPAAMAGCASLGFDSISLHTEGLLSTKKASSSSGFVFRLRNEDAGLADPRLRIRSHAEKAVVQLPDGVTLNPSLGAGLDVCTPAQLATESAFNPPGAGCPNGSKIGVFSVRVPFYQGILRGSIYLAQPNHPATGASGAENPFDSLLAVYLIAKSADRGLLIRVPGELAPDLGEGTITATFDGLPQLPYTDLEVSFRSGQRAPLISPPRCGAAITQIAMMPSSGGRTDVSSTDSPIDSGIDAGPCPDGSTPPFAPGAVAGGVNSNVGSYTPYFVHLSREDTEQEITSYSLILPKGITGKLAGIPFCPEAAVEAARHRLGFDEIADPSCPAASQVGRTDTGYGVGSALTYAPGRIYLAGPHGGSPLSLVTINAATVGPFDLGTIVIRSAFDVDQRTAQLEIDSTASDPIPHIIDGIPLHLRDVRVYMDRFQFTHNPSSCEPSALVSTLTGSGASFATAVDDSTATVSKHFQLLNCLTLDFRPRLGLRLRGGARRGSYPSLRATFVSRGAEDSNLKRIAVEMPHALFLAQNHIRTVCTRGQFAAERCPQRSIYGRAVAETLLFDEPLRGNVYLRSSQNKLPDLVADLRSGAVRIVVEGRIGPGKHGGILTFFDNLPDAPIDRFTMTLFGGRHGLLQNSSNICNAPPLATVSALGQNNIGARFSSVLRGQCGKKRRGHRADRGRAGNEVTAGASTITQKGNLRVNVSGKLSPRKLPRTEVAPIAVSVGGRISTTDASLPPQLKKLRIELNRNGKLDYKGLPTCRFSRIQPGSSSRALSQCRSSLVGKGSFTANITLAGQEPYPTRGRLLVFNSRRGRKPVLYGHIYSPKPFATSFVIVFKIQRLGKGTYGTALNAPLPKAMDAWGRLTGLEMTLSRRYSHRGKRHSYLSSGCPAPRGFSRAIFPLARTSFAFAGGKELTSVFTDTCKVRNQ